MGVLHKPVSLKTIVKQGRMLIVIRLIGIFCVVIAIICLPLTDPIPGTPYGRRFKTFDYVGSILFAAALTCFVMAINFGGTLFDWSSGSTIALFIIGGVLFIAFAVQQSLSLLVSKEDRIFPIHFLSNWNAVLVFIATAAVNSACFIRKSLSTYFTRSHH